MWRRCPIRIANSQVFCYARDGHKDGLPFFRLMLPQDAIKRKRLILCYPYVKVHVTSGAIPR
jgi:hypothetical protein